LNNFSDLKQAHREWITDLYSDNNYSEKYFVRYSTEGKD